MNTIKQKMLPHYSQLYAIICAVLILTILHAQKKVYYKHKVADAMIFNLVTEENIEGGFNKLIYSDKTGTSPSKPIMGVVNSKRGENDIINSRITDVLNGTVLFEKISDKYSSIIYSKHGNYIGVRESLEKPEYGKSIKNKITYYRPNGEVMWEKEFLRHWDSPSIYPVISDNTGKVVEINPDGRLNFYNINGVQTNSYKLLKTYAEEGGVGGRFSDNGQFFVATAAGDQGREYPNTTAIALFTSEGEHLWTYETKLYYAGSRPWISADGTYIIWITMNPYGENPEANIYILNKKGENLLTLTKPRLSLSEVVFSQSEKYVFLNMVDELRVYDLETMELVLFHSSRGTGRKILNTDIHEGTETIAILEGYISRRRIDKPNSDLRNCKIKVINFERVTVFERDLPDISQPVIHTKISYSGDGNKIGVTTGSKYYEFQKQ